jgi:hypothetical protein
MSIYLATEMIVGFFKTNNPLRYHRFAEKLFQETKRTGILAIPVGSTFLRELERFLFVTYGGWNGTNDQTGKTEGAMRTQPCTIHPQSDWAQESSLITWLNLSQDWANRFRTKLLAEKDHCRLNRDIKNSMIGLGDLFAQKLIFADAALGITLPISCFNSCLPGSSQHMKALRKRPFNFDRTDQVAQLVTSIAVKENLVREVAEEIVCLTLKGEQSLGMYQEVSIKGCDLFSTTYNDEGRITINRLDYSNGHQEPARRGGFTASPGHYFPQWAEVGNVSEYCYNHVRMSSMSNFRFSIVEKSSKVQISALENEPVHFEPPGVEFDQVQVLLNSNKYLHVSDPVNELATYLGVSKEAMVAAIRVKTRGQGYIAYMEEAAFSEVKLDVQFLQIDVVSNHPLNTHFLFLDHHREYTSNPEEIHNSFFVPESYGRNSDI